MKLWATSDLHLGYAINRQAVEALEPRPDDWLIVAGDLGDTPEQIEWGLAALRPKFAQLLWTPGNHDLWTLPGSHAPRGLALYRLLVSRCRAHGVLTPEDPYPLFDDGIQPHQVVLLFTLYDYSFAPDDLSPADAVAWAAETGIVCADENLLHFEPHSSRTAWCQARVAYCEHRLSSLSPGVPTVLVNHFPLRRDLVRLPSIPRFSVWCGTRATEDWHLRYAARVVVSGHLHVRTTDYRDGVRFEEVSLGYPRQWRPDRGLGAYLREILPGPEA